MPVWKLSPIARKDDPHWKGYQYKDPLLVKAEDYVDVRRKATRWYKDKYQGDPDIKIDQFYRSAFSDEKLYQVTELSLDETEEQSQQYPLVK